LNKDFQLGFRPSTFQEKVMPTLSSFTSNLGNLSSGIGAVNGVNILSDYINFNKIEIVDLENIQGMSLPPKSILILDEFQLIEAANDGRAILSRIGEDSLVICLGDLRQMASQKHSIEESALYHLINTFSGYEKYAHIVMEEVVRSGFVAELDRRW
jgi:PhoH-like ATPase